VCQPETSQSNGSALAATIRWVSGVVEGSPSQPKKEKKVEIQPQVESVCQPDVPWEPQTGGSVALSKEVPVSQKPNQVESQPLVESVCPPDTSWSEKSALAATIILGQWRR